MAAPTGNQFWKARSKHGRDKIFSDDGKLWESACEYFQWCEDNPLTEQKIFHAAGVITKDTVTKMRAMTIAGLCVFFGIGTSTWSDYKKNKDFTAVITRIEDIIYNQKFMGAAADMLNPNIIARDLGLADKKETKDTSTEISDEDLNAKILELMGKFK